MEVTRTWGFPAPSESPSFLPSHATASSQPITRQPTPRWQAWRPLSNIGAELQSQRFPDDRECPLRPYRRPSAGDGRNCALCEQLPSRDGQ